MNYELMHVSNVLFVMVEVFQYDATTLCIYHLEINLLINMKFCAETFLILVFYEYIISNYSATQISVTRSNKRHALALM